MFRSGPTTPCVRARLFKYFEKNVKLFFLSTFVVVKVEKKTGEGSRLRRHSSTNGQARTLLYNTPEKRTRRLIQSAVNSLFQPKTFHSLFHLLLRPLKLTKNSLPVFDE